MHLATSFSYMMIEQLLICPCDLFTNNQYLDLFYCNIPFKQDQVICSKPKRSKDILKC